MARQEIKLGAFWDVIFNAINANFAELYDANGNAVTAETLTQQLASYITSTALTQQLASYATTAALNQGLGNKVDKITGKDLSTNDFTNAYKSKLDGLTAPTKAEFTANSWGTADGNGVYSYAIQSAQNVAAVYRANGSMFENAAVAIEVNGGTITLKSEETFAGYVILV